MSHGDSDSGRREIKKESRPGSDTGIGTRKLNIPSTLQSGRSISWLYDSFYTARNTMEGLANALSSFSHVGSTSRINAGKDGRPVFLFGKRFELCSRSDKKASEETVRFLREFKSVVWLTYRRNFFPIQPPLGYTSDTGWGCMLRSAQMILAETLQRHLGSKWRYIQEETENVDEETMVITAEHRKLLRWFIDAPKFFSFYSIHRMSECGRRYGKKAGEWYGPTTVSWVLRDLVEAHRTLKKETKESEEFMLLSGGQQELTMLVADQGTIYVEDVQNLCEPVREDEKNQSSVTKIEDNDPLLRPGALPVWSTALFLLVPVRLGLNHINPDYIPALLNILQFPQCVGMIGGKPAHSLFFVGSQDDRLLYLDPHTVHDAATNENCADTSFPHKKDITTYHCNDPKLMTASEIDPSLAIGFYCKSVGDFMDLRGRIGQLEGPVFLSVMDKKPNYDFDDPEEGENAEEDEDEWYDVG